VSAPPGPGPLQALQRFVAPRAAARPEEVCEMCAAAIAPEHGHVVNVETRRLLCTCRACFLLFAPRGAAGGKFRAVPDRILRLGALGLAPAQWDALQIPVGMAFFFFNSTLARMAAFYPGPAGATESLLPLDAWQALLDAHPVLSTLEPDVEALLVYASRGGQVDGFLVPIDACYELTGRVRRSWRGFDGGQEAHDRIGSFFDELRARAREVGS
jgi:hypothetical protein